MSTNQRIKQSNEWTINLESICRAAARNERKAIRSCLNDTNLTSSGPINDTSSNNSTHQITKRGSHNRYEPQRWSKEGHSDSFSDSCDEMLPSSQVASTLLHLLFYPTSNKAQNCNDYFSNVIIDMTFPNSSDLDQEQQQQQKFQLSMSFRSLLFIPMHYATPWDAVTIFVTLFQQKLNGDSSETAIYYNSPLGLGSQSLFIHYCSIDVIFLKGIIGDIRHFLHERVMKEFFSLKNSRVDNIHICIKAIECALIDLFSVTASIVKYNETSHREGNDLTIQHKQQNMLTEMGIILINIGKSIDTCEMQECSGTVLSTMMDSLLPQGEEAHRRNNSIHIRNVLPLLTLCSGISSHMTSLHWLHLQRIVYDGIQRTHIGIVSTLKPSSMYTEIFCAVLKFIVSYDYIIHESASSELSWIEILVEIYSLIRENPDIFHEIESQFMASISQITTQKCEQLVKLITNLATSKERYNEYYKGDSNQYHGRACNNLMFLIMNVHMGKKTLGTEKIILESFDEKGDNAIMDTILQAIYLLNDLDNGQLLQQAPYSGLYDTNNWNELCTFFQGIFYTTTAQVQRISDCHIVQDYLRPMQKCVDFVQSALCFVDNKMILQRVQIFLNVANHILETVYDNNVLDTRQILLSASIFITIFGEVPCSRSIIINYIAESIQDRDSPQSLPHPSMKRILYCWFLFTCWNTLERQNIDDKEIFEPLLRLLRSEQPKLGGSKVKPSVLSELVRVLSWNRHCRYEVLVFAESIIGATNNNTQSSIDTTISIEDIYRLAIKAYTSLIQERGSHAKSIEQGPIDIVSFEALTCIIKMILLNKPMQTLHMRSIIFSEVCSLVEQNACNSWISMRLWVATTIKLLEHFQFTSSTKSVSDPNTYEYVYSIRNETDITCLLKLSLVFMKKMNTRQSLNTEEKTITTEEIGIFFNPKQFAKMTKEGIDVRLINLVCYRRMIEVVLPPTTPYSISANVSPFASPDTDDETYFDAHSLQELLFDKECQIMREIIFRISRGNAPFWSESYDVLLSAAFMRFPKSLCDSERAEMLDPAVYDTLSSFMIEMIDEISLSEDRSNVNDRNYKMIWLVERLTIVQCQKYQYNPYRIDSGSTANYFLNASKILQNVLEIKIDHGSTHVILKQLKTFIASIIMFSDTLKSFCREFCERGVYGIPHEGIGTIQALWVYYNSSCNEIACCRMIDFIESCYTEVSKLSREDAEIDCFRSSELIYDFVRKHRESCLACFGSLFQLFEQTDAWGNRKDGYFMFCTDLVCLFVIDLCSGFKAMSGGMTKSLYGYYVQTIEDGILAALKIDPFLIVDACGGIENDIFFDWQRNCIAASKDLWDAICTVDIKSPPAYKVTMRICLGHLPQLYRKIDRIALSSAIQLRKGYNERQQSLDCYESRVLELCIINASKKKSEKLEAQLQDRTYEDKARQKSGLSKVLQSNKKLLEWTHEYSLQSIEAMWAECLETINCKRTIETGLEISECSSSINQEVRRHMASYILHQQYILNQSLSAIKSQFISLLHLIKSNSSTIEIPYLIGRRICSCLEKIVATLKASIRLILQNKSNTNAVLKISESVACLRAWLTSNDLLCLITKYHSEESKDVSGSKTNLMYSRFSKVMHQMKDIDKTLRQLKKKLEKSKNVGINYDLGYIFHQSLLGYRNADNLTVQDCSDLLQLINEYHDVVDSNVAQKSPEDDATNNQNKNKNVLKLQTNNVNRKRLREARRDKRRSKNNVIDEWMYLDCELEEDKNDIDHEEYEDLEDFILPG